MRRPGIRALAAFAVVGSALAACSDDEGPSALLPSSAFPVDTGAVPPLTGATGTIPTGPTGVLPSTPTGGSTGTLASGQAAVTVNGDVRASKTMSNLFAGVYAAPPGGMAVVWTAGGSDATTLGLGGLSFTGTQPTAATLSLTLTVQTSGEISSFVSTAGECSVTIGLASASELSGAFTCSGLVGSAGEVVDASGSFAAQG
jgi:hypothetical protein